jgi:hypothetical protein
MPKRLSAFLSAGIFRDKNSQDLNDEIRNVEIRMNDECSNTAYCLLPAARCPLPAARCPLPAARRAFAFRSFSFSVQRVVVMSWHETCL